MRGAPPPACGVPVGRGGRRSQENHAGAGGLAPAGHRARSPGSRACGSPHSLIMTGPASPQPQKAKVNTLKIRRKRRGDRACQRQSPGGPGGGCRSGGAGSTRGSGESPRTERKTELLPAVLVPRQPRTPAQLLLPRPHRAAFLGHSFFRKRILHCILTC